MSKYIEIFNKENVMISLNRDKIVAVFKSENGNALIQMEGNFGNGQGIAVLAKMGYEEFMRMVNQEQKQVD